MAGKKYLDDVGTEYLVEKINDKIQPQFVGTIAEWEALSADDKAKFVVVNLTDDYTVTSAVVDEVTEGEGRAVSSGAVFNAINTVTSGVGTRNTAYLSENNFIANWWKVGRLCTVDIQYNTSALVDSNQEIISGLPKPVTQIAVAGQGNGNSAVSGFCIKTNGTVRTHYSAESGTFMHGSATYITAE